MPHIRRAFADIYVIGIYLLTYQLSCLKIGQAYRPTHECRNISTLDGHDIMWSDSIRYLGVYIKSAKTFTCCLSHAKLSFIVPLTPS